MANPVDLVTPTQVINWLNSQSSRFASTDQQLLIPQCITAASQYWLQRTGRSSLNHIMPYTDILDGSGSDRQYVRNGPIISVASVIADGVTIPQGAYKSDGTIHPGWVIDLPGRESLKIIGQTPGMNFIRASGSYGVTGSNYRVNAGWFFRNVRIQYFGGFTRTDGEFATVPGTPYAYTVANAGTNGASFFMDLGVTYVQPQNGQLVVLTQVPSAPAQGQYSVSPAGVYTFAAADQGAQVSIAYAYHGVPVDIQDAVVKQVALNYRRRNWIGQASEGNKELGETRYTTWEIPPEVESVIQYYKRVALVGA